MCTTCTLKLFEHGEEVQGLEVVASVHVYLLETQRTKVSSPHRDQAIQRNPHRPFLEADMIPQRVEPCRGPPVTERSHGNGTVRYIL